MNLADLGRGLELLEIHKDARSEQKVRAARVMVWYLV